MKNFIFKPNPAGLYTHNGVAGNVIQIAFGATPPASVITVRAESATAAAGLLGLVVIDSAMAAFRATMRPIRNYQLRLWLLSQGITGATVDAKIEAMPEGEAKEAAKIEWNMREWVPRDHPLVASIGAELGLTPEQIDAGYATCPAT